MTHIDTVVQGMQCHPHGTKYMVVTSIFICFQFLTGSDSCPIEFTSPRDISVLSTLTKENTFVQTINGLVQNADSMSQDAIDDSQFMTVKVMIGFGFDPKVVNALLPKWLIEFL